MSSTDRGRISYLLQADCAVLPTAPAWQIAAITSSSFAFQKQTVESNIIDSSAQPVDTVKVGAKSAGTVGFEWTASVGSRTFLEAALRGAFTNPVNDTGAAVIATPAKTLTLTGAFTHAVVGQWILLAGFVAGESYDGAKDSPNNGWYKIATLTSNDVVVLSDPRGTLIAETAPVTATVKSKRLINGVIERCFAVEEGLLDVGAFFLFLGQRLNTLSMSLSAGQIVTGEAAFMGSDVKEETPAVKYNGVINVQGTTRTVTAPGSTVFATAKPGQKITLADMIYPGNNVTGEIATVISSASVTLTAATTGMVDETGIGNGSVVGAAASWSDGGTYAPASTAPSFNATSNVGDIIVNANTSAACFKTLNLTINNNLRETPCIGTDFPRIDYGTPALTGSLEKVFVDASLWRKMKDHGTVGIDIGLVATNGLTGIHVSIPKAYLNTDTVDLSGGRNSDVLDKIDFSAAKYTNAAEETYYCEVCMN